MPDLQASRTSCWGDIRLTVVRRWEAWHRIPHSPCFYRNPHGDSRNSRGWGPQSSRLQVSSLGASTS